jgi:hypothetical protein
MIDDFENMTDYPAWDKTAIDVYGLKPCFVRSGGDLIKLFFFKPFYSAGYMATAPYADYGGVLVEGGRVKADMVAELRQLLESSRARYLLIRTKDPVFRDVPDVRIDRSNFTFKLDLRPGIDKIWERTLNSKKRNHIRQALKRKWDIREGGLELLDDFYKVVSACWRNLGTPTHGKAFYRALISNFLPAIRIFVVYNGRVPVSAGLVYILRKGISIFIFTLNSYKKLGVNELLYWTVIQFGCRSGLEYVNMGRSHISQGTYPYKMSWGAEPIQIDNVYLLNRRVRPIDLRSPIVRGLTSIWKRVPVPLANLLGPRLIRRIL